MNFCRARLERLIGFFVLISPIQSILCQVVNNDDPFQHIEYIGTDRGLNGSEVFAITQDRMGFIWVITDNALNRYDGYSFRSFAYDPNDPDAFTTGWYWGLIEDHEGHLWTPGQETGVYSFDPRKEKFTHYLPENGNPVSINSEQTNCVMVDGQGRVVIGTNAGLECFDPSTKAFTLYTSSEDDPFSLHSDVICAFCPDGNNPGIIWVLLDDFSLDAFNVETGRVIEHIDFPFSKDLYMDGPSPSMNLSRSSKDIMWYGANETGIFGINTQTREPVFIKMEDGHTGKYAIRGFYPVCEDNQGNIWTANNLNEIVCYDIDEKSFQFYKVKDKKIQFFELGPCIFQDKADKIWMGTNNGLITINKRNKKITTFYHTEDPTSISGDFVFDIFRTRQGELLVGTTDELDVFDEKKQQFSRLPLFQKGERIDAFSAWNINQDSKDVVWLVGNFGMASYDPFTNQARNYHLTYNGSPVNMEGAVGFVEDRLGNYWVSIWKSGLFHFDPVTGIAKKSFTMADMPNSVVTNSLGPMYLNADGVIYICGWESGMMTYDPVREQFKTFYHDVKDPSSINNESAHAFIERDGIYWFGTLGGGLNVFDPKTEKFAAFTTDDGLIHNCVVSLTEDKKGNFWAGTRGGISCFTPPEFPFDSDGRIQFRNYDISDGLPSNVLNFQSAFCDLDGTLYFGTRNAGLFCFHPDSLQDNSYIPPVHITELSILNKPIHVNDGSGFLDKAIEYTDKLELSYKYNIISFSFAALNFVQAEKNKYAYMLEGYDEEWIYTDASKRFASYTNLDAGDYVFKVMGSNNDGIWNDVPTQLAITIHPPFWATAWFRVLLVFLVSGSAYALYRFRMQQVMEVQMIRNKIAHDLHDNIGSTLNSISIFSEVAQNKIKERIPELELIGEGSRKVIDSMSDIVWTINPDNDSFEKIIFRMRSLTHSLMKAKSIEYSFKTDEKLNDITLPMQTRKHFYLIFKEAINNMLKYSQASRASIMLSYDDNKIDLLIRDNGIGFDTHNPTRGNGLNNMRMRAKEIRADFAINSNIGEGTSIQLQFYAK